MNPGDASAPPPRVWVTVVRWVSLLGFWVLLTAILVQFYLAGRAIFGVGSFDPHEEMGFVVAYLLAITLALVGLQPSLALIQARYPELSALLPLNAMLMFAGGLWTQRRIRRRLREARSSRSPLMATSGSMRGGRWSTRPGFLAAETEEGARSDHDDPDIGDARGG